MTSPSWRGPSWRRGAGTSSGFSRLATGLLPAGSQRSRAGVSATIAVGGGIVGLIVAVGLLSLVWTPYDPGTIDPTSRLQLSSSAHWLGTDKFGRDVLSLIMAGSRTTLVVGVVAVGVAAIVGVPLGILSAMVPKWWGEVIMRANDTGDHAHRGARARRGHGDDRHRDRKHPVLRSGGPLRCHRGDED